MRTAAKTNKPKEKEIIWTRSGGGQLPHHSANQAVAGLKLMFSPYVVWALVPAVVATLISAVFTFW